MTRSTDKAPADWTRAALREALSGNGFVREITTGSMAPVLVPGDVVRLTRGVRPPRAGEIWAFESTSRRGQHIAHRVLCRRADGRVLRATTSSGQTVGSKRGASLVLPWSAAAMAAGNP